MTSSHESRWRICENRKYQLWLKLLLRWIRSKPKFIWKTIARLKVQSSRAQCWNWTATQFRMILRWKSSTEIFLGTDPTLKAWCQGKVLRVQLAKRVWHLTRILPTGLRRISFVEGWECFIYNAGTDPKQTNKQTIYYLLNIYVFCWVDERAT